MHKGAVTSLVFASSVNLLFSGSIDGSIGVWTDKGVLLQVGNPSWLGLLLARGCSWQGAAPGQGLCSWQGGAPGKGCSWQGAAPGKGLLLARGCSCPLAVTPQQRAVQAGAALGD